MKEFINQQKIAKDTAGGIVETHVFGCPIGLGSCMTWDGRLDCAHRGGGGGIQAFKGVEFGLGFEAAKRPGSRCMMRLDLIRRSEYAGDGVCAADEQCWGTGRRDDQRAAGGGARGDEADQHAGQAADVGGFEDEGKIGSGMGALGYFGDLAAGVVMENVIAFEMGGR